MDDGYKKETILGVLLKCPIEAVLLAMPAQFTSDFVMRM